MDREDTDSESRATNDDPTSPIAVNGLGSPNSTADTENMPSIASPIVGRRGRNYNEYCHRTLLQTSSESVDELPTMPPEIIGGSVSDDSKYKYTICLDTSDPEIPTTSQNSRMLSDLCDAIRPCIKKNVECYGDPYKGDTFFSAKKDN